ncbi:MAG: ComF family protein [Candidatus Brocadia sinica]|nr:ComF family protein [Candidatus Brocadia sinica]NUO04659.1 ComF family protein [Candidatus Brocadia sinica]
MAIGEYIHAFLDLFYPRSCLHCNCNLNNSYELYLCEHCKRKIPYISHSCCIRCGAILGPHITPRAKEGCAACKGKYLPFNTITSVTYYDDAMKTLIHKFKYARQKFLASVLSDILITHERLKEVVPDTDVIVPVPLHWLKQMLRGFNQSELLSQGIQRHFSKSVAINNLCRIKNTASQTQLSKNQRQRNIHNAFFINHPGSFKGKKVLLVDDVLTTGVTASECSKKLKEAGAVAVHLLILATARHPD